MEKRAIIIIIIIMIVAILTTVFVLIIYDSSQIEKNHYEIEEVMNVVLRKES